MPCLGPRESMFLGAGQQVVDPPRDSIGNEPNHSRTVMSVRDIPSRARVVKESASRRPPALNASCDDDWVQYVVRNRFRKGA